MDWDKLRIFHVVAEAGSFTHAGEKLNLSQSAVSRQISSLEHELGVPLFNRHARGLVLTEQGEILFNTAHDVYGRLETTRARLTDASAKPYGPLRVTTTVGFGSAWLTPRLEGFIKLYPDIQLQLILLNQELDLSIREADIALRLRQPIQQGLIQRKLFTVHNHVFASPGYIKQMGIPRKPKDLDDHRIMTFGPAPEFLKGINWLETAGRKGRPRREPVLRIDNLYGLKQAVLAGIGIAMLPDYIIGDNTSLVTLLPKSETPSFDTYFVYTEEMRNSKRVAVFHDFLKATARHWHY